MQQIESEYIKMCRLQIEINTATNDLNETIKNIKSILQQNKIELNEIYDKIKHKPEWLKLYMILDDRWLSPYMDHNEVIKEMVDKIETIKGEYTLLESLIGNVDIGKKVYRETLSYKAAVASMN
ncbi:hypothetical protein [Eubacterium sp.]|uniref:hypothetical protein n=1 Tax=Eubacterium sp. TaxID=142586 RepID=UPI0025E1E4EA|nr:hypothetical protein [Eubacterium sp.]MCR5629876.1 hypothetical protein [Eubacterium sp.]